MTDTSTALEAPPILKEFLPLAALWRAEGAPFPSEQAARWALRTHRQALTEADALALWRGRMFVHPHRFVEVMNRAAIEAAGQRAGRTQQGSAV